MANRRILAVVNQKGGVGKTTSTLNIGAGLARLGRRVLLVDLDPQAHLTCSLGLDTAGRPTLAQALAGDAPLSDCLMRAGDLDLAPSCLALAGLEARLAGQPADQSAGREGAEHRLARALDQFWGHGPAHDYVLLDCPPHLGLLALNALVAARGLLVPVQPEYLALHSLSVLLDTVAQVREGLNPGLALAGVFLTRHSDRRRLNREVASQLRAHFGPRLLDTRIRECVALAEAPGFGQDIFRYAPSSNASRDYLRLSREILNLEETS